MTFVDRLLVARRLAAMGALLAAAALVGQRAETTRASQAALRSEAHLPDTRILRPALLGFHVLASDAWWLQAIQYYGRRSNAREQYRGLAPLMDLVVGLDPEFCYAYRFAGVTLPYNTGHGWVGVDESNRILDKGLENETCKKVWQIPFIRGYNAFWFGEDMALSAKYTGLAAQLPGAPAFLPLLATRLLAHTGMLDVAIDYAARMAEHAEDPKTREDMRNRLLDLLAESELRRMESAIESHQKDKGVVPPSMRALEALLSPPLRHEPHGGRWIYDAAAGTVRSDRMEKRVRLGEFALRQIERHRQESRAEEGKKP